MHQVHRSIIRVGSQRYDMEILFQTERLLRNDASGKDAVAYLRSLNLSEADEDRYFREGERRAWG